MFVTQVLRMASLQLTPTLGGLKTRDMSVRKWAERKTLAAVCFSGALLPLPPSPTNQLSFARCDSDSLVQTNVTVHNFFGVLSGGFFWAVTNVFLYLCNKKKKTEKKLLPISK